mmetsp:Transcript_82059/g.250779  ORF Transcript_82059/g.250779 Transcript_82059/m.250779 type:complete len:224 (-) Transcript_82059:977-1648(-)
MLRHRGPPVLRKDPRRLGWVQGCLYQGHRLDRCRQCPMDLRQARREVVPGGRLGERAMRGGWRRLQALPVLQTAWPRLLRQERLVGRMQELVQQGMGVELQRAGFAHAVGARAITGFGELGGDELFQGGRGVRIDEVLQRARDAVLPQGRRVGEVQAVVPSGARPAGHGRQAVELRGAGTPHARARVAHSHGGRALGEGAMLQAVRGLHAERVLPETWHAVLR